MLNFKNYDDFIEYLSDNVIGQDKVSLILLEETMNDLVAQLDKYIKENANTYVTISNNESEEYILIKTEYDNGEISVIVEPLVRDGVIKNIEDELVIIEDDVLSDEQIDKHIETKELKIVGLEYNQKQELEENECNCSECEDYSCEFNCNSSDESDEVLEEIKEYLNEEIEIYKHDRDMTLNDLVLKVYLTAFESGQKEVLLGLRESISEALEE